jgi:hypothetical protein
MNRGPVAAQACDDREYAEGIAADELKRIVRLWLVIHAHDLEARPVVAHRCAPRAAEKVK